MKYENINKLRQAIVGKTVVSVETQGCHGMVLALIFDDRTTLDICTYDDGKRHDDEFCVVLNKGEL